MKRSLLIFVLILLPLFSAQAFVLMGEPDATEGVNFNYVDDFGAPKEISLNGSKRFYRWNIPYFVYSFDATFVQYFGLEGMDAVHEAFGVVNDFFINEDYEGVSQLDLAKHGFVSNYNTTWVNTTAKNAQIIDIKSLVLGIVVDMLGIGNPHRWAYSITDARQNTAATQVIFETRLRNYDPMTHEPTDIINGVKYSYRLVHDAANPSVQANAPPNIADMEEFTTDATGNAWSSVSAITDAFYGNTSLWWTDTPSLFNFGVYYDGMNAMGGQYKPRHALTYDDAGGLKYLYSTNNFIWEDLPQDIILLEPAQLLPPHLASRWPDPSGRQLPIFPHSGAQNFTSPTPTLTTTIMGLPGIGTNGPAFMGEALRGGIDKFQFYHGPLDSLLGLNFNPTNFTWMDTFVFHNNWPNVVNISDANGRTIGTINNKRSGIQWLTPNADVKGANFWRQGHVESSFHSQKVGREVFSPDLVFTAAHLPPSPDGVPVGWQRPINNYWDMSHLNTGYMGVADTNIGPGIITDFGGGLGIGEQIVLNNSYPNENIFEVIWSGETTVVGGNDLYPQPTLWGWIKGPGPNDVVTFPDGKTQWLVMNDLMPKVAPPTITMVSDNGGQTAIQEQSLTRTEEILTLIGSNLASVTAIEIMNGNLVVQTIMPAEQYIVTDQRIDIPTGIISDAAEGSARTVRVWNTVGASEVGPQKFSIRTGRPVITGTDYDNTVFDRAQVATIRGYGFKSKNAGETRLAFIRVDDSEGTAVDDNGTAGGGASNGLPRPVTFEMISDTMAVMPIHAINPYADGSNRRLRVARKTVVNAADLDSVLSPGTNPMFTVITTKPVISTLTQLEDNGSTWTTLTDNGAFRRDLVLEINGTALNTASVIEVIQEDGTSFANPVFIQLPGPGVAVDDNGTRIQLSAGAIPYNDADTNTTARRSFKIYNAVGNTALNASQMFAVNTQPVFDAISGFALAGYMNRDKTLGDDISIFGSGFNVISQVIFTDANDTSVSHVTIDLPSPGITVTDSEIAIDTSTYQLSSALDTDINSTRRSIKLVSARDDATMPFAQRFYVGAPPTITTLSGGDLTDGNFTRDTESIMVEGSGFGHTTTLEIVDVFGNPIAGVPGLISGPDGTGGTGLTINNATAVSVGPDPSGWVTVGYLLDAVTVQTRRVKITTPFGSATSSTAEGNGSFTVSATPELMNTVQATFAGGGYSADDTTDNTDDNGTYDRSEGDLVINGTNFRGVSLINLMSNGNATFDANITVDPFNPPTGIAFNAAGTQITIDGTALPASWIGELNATVRVTSVSGGNATSSPIQTQE